jgi:hypothetical protein
MSHARARGSSILIALPLTPFLQVVLPAGYRRNAFVAREGVPVDGLAHLLDQERCP